MTAAVESGADAVYLAGNMFGARAYADNFDEDGLREAIIGRLLGFDVVVCASSTRRARTPRSCRTSAFIGSRVRRRPVCRCMRARR